MVNRHKKTRVAMCVIRIRALYLILGGAIVTGR